MKKQIDKCKNHKNVFIISLIFLYISFSLIGCNNNTSMHNIPFESNITLDFSESNITDDDLIYLNCYNCESKLEKIDSFHTNKRKYILKKHFKESVFVWLAKEGNKKQEVISPQFIISREPITITIKLDKKGINSKISGKEFVFYEANKLKYYIPNSNFDCNEIALYGYLDKKNPNYNKWVKSQNNLVEWIGNSKNYFLSIQKLYDNKKMMSDKSLEKCLSILKDNFQGTGYYNEIQGYYEERKKLRSSNFFPVLKLKNLNLESETIAYSDNKKYYIVDIWASWCGPCRKQVNLIKQNYSKIDTAKVQIISLSIDENNQKWLKANQDEQLLWKSYLISDDVANKPFLKTINSIPAYFLLDENKKIIARYSDIDSVKVIDLKKAKNTK